VLWPQTATARLQVKLPPSHGYSGRAPTIHTIALEICVLDVLYWHAWNA